ncbi:septum formation initiator family protein [Corynebacterium sp. H128]|uniref:FtsB family cell division protein n=1 Tax=Corynebacterium sp. H128 TaxID=3133427 RepID=UPI0030AFC5FB
MSAIELIVLISVLIVFLLIIALPLRNYFQQRNEINEVTQAIVQKQARKDELLGELERYQNPAYLEEQARNRLGVIAPGEVAFRILDPTMQGEESLTSTSGHQEKPQAPWYNTLWDSVANPSPQVTGAPEAPPTPEMKMPVQSDASSP